MFHRKCVIKCNKDSIFSKIHKIEPTVLALKVPIMSKRIRSNYRRRLLYWLADGGGTISEGAKAVGLRLPHASAELKKLRQNGFAVGDKEVGSRGAVQRLTGLGRELLHEDEMAAFTRIKLDSKPNNAIGCVLARDRQMLLLAYNKKPVNRLIPLPKRPFGTNNSTDTSSSGNEGGLSNWVWAVQQIGGEHWVNEEGLASIAPSLEVNGGGTIDDWEEVKAPWVIIRVNLFEERGDLTLSFGSWIGDIGELDEGGWPELPRGCVGGDWNLGLALPSSLPISPFECVIAPISARLGRGLILRTAAKGAWILADLDLLAGESTPLPLEVLMKWIEVAHPRLYQEELLDRHNWLRSELLGRNRQLKRTSGQQATWQRFRKAWPKAIWRQKNPPFDSMWNLRGMDRSASFALIEWALDNSPVPVVIQWPLDLENDVDKLKHISKHPNLRLLITSGWEPKGDSLILRISESGMPSMEIGSAGSNPLPFTLTNTPVSAYSVPSIELPQNISDLAPTKQELLNSGMKVPKTIPAPSNILSQSTLFSCMLYPHGDSSWANLCEVSNPLAAWIATPNSERAERWERIHARISTQWIGLLEPESVANIQMSRYAVLDADWSRRASHEMQSRIHKNPDILLDLHPIALGNVDSWYAGVALSVAPLLPRDHAKDIVSWAWSVWSAEPEHEMEHVLPCLENLSQKGLLKKGWSKDVFVDQRPLGHPMHMWKELCLISTGAPLEEDDAILIISQLPWRWWAGWANQLLIAAIQTAKGREVLSQTNLPWAAILFQAAGAPSPSPGTLVTYSGCSAEIEIVLAQHRYDLLRRGGLGTEQLLDVHDSLLAIVENKPPPFGRCHPLVGWLIQPLETWPPLDIDYWADSDNAISQALLNRQSGYHEGLLSPEQQRLT